MKLPRWLLIGLWTSIVLSVLAAAGWWWVTWPQRTAREFVELVQAGNIIEAREMIWSRDEEWDFRGTGLGARKNEHYPGWLVYLSERPLPVTALPRTPRDLLNGEQEFSVGRRHTMRIARGRIVSAHLLELPESPRLSRSQFTATQHPPPGSRPSR